MKIPLGAKRHIEAEEFEQAIRILSPLAEQGDADAQFLLGYLHFTSAEVDPAWAKDWLQRAAAQNHAEACYFLSLWIDDNHSGPPQTEEAWELFFRAAELGSAAAQQELGSSYAMGWQGLPVDGERSRLWYTRAAEQGDGEAEYNLGLMWLDGEGGPIDIERGLAWLVKAATHPEHDHAMATAAASVLAYTYEHGRYGQQPDTETARRWREREAELEQRPFRSHPDWFYEEDTYQIRHNLLLRLEVRNEARQTHHRPDRGGCRDLSLLSGSSLPDTF